jgi:peptidoglycan/LPS O-acetylase OafA/YrhL
MSDRGSRITRRRALTGLLLLLLLAPIPLTRISGLLADPQHPQRASGDAVFWFILAVVVMGSAVRGNRSALGLWAVLSAVIGAAMVLWSLTAEQGSVRLLAGLIAIAVSIVLVFLRGELAEGSVERSARSEARADANTR